MMQRTRKPKQPEKALTAVELQMMNIIWRIGPCTVSQVVEQLAAHRELAYTSVSTIVRILEQKGYVSSTKEGRGHSYAATVAKETYQSMSLSQLVSNVFDDTPSMLVQRLLDSKQLTAADIAQIKALLQTKDR